MNDKEIKNLLSKDKSLPPSPVNEWSQIQSRVGKQQENFFSSFKLQMSAAICFTVLLITFISVNDKESPISDIEKRSLVEFILEDNYIYDNQDLYSWVD